MMQIKKAERSQAKLRCSLIGISGSGKTYSALRLAKGLGGKICVIDTECGSASLYSDDFEYDVLPLEAPFNPEKYIKAIKLIEQSGYDTIIIDSLSHAWTGSGGVLDIQADKTKGSAKGNSYTAWKDVTPLQNRFIETILQSKCHVITTIRAKTHYGLSQNKDGKQVPSKLGLAPIQREGLEYEFTVVFDISEQNMASSTKDRTKLFKDRDLIITEETGVELKGWLNSAKKIEEVKEIKEVNMVPVYVESDAYSDLEKGSIILDAQTLLESFKDLINASINYDDVKSKFGEGYTEFKKMEEKYKGVKELVDYFVKCKLDLQQAYLNNNFVVEFKKTGG